MIKKTNRMSLGTNARALEHPWNKTLSLWGAFQQLPGGKAIESSGFMERAMGIEQIQSAKIKALLPAPQFNWSQMESNPRDRYRTSAVGIC
jgi:hypothetical protein